jgi:hypothetical protein
MSFSTVSTARATVCLRKRRQSQGAGKRTAIGTATSTPRRRCGLFSGLGAERWSRPPPSLEARRVRAWIAVSNIFVNEPDILISNFNCLAVEKLPADLAAPSSSRLMRIQLGILLLSRSYSCYVLILGRSARRLGPNVDADACG